MHRIAILYHSAHGHTEHIARCIHEGIQQVADLQTDLLQAQNLLARPEDLPCLRRPDPRLAHLLGGVSAPLKALMDATGGLWRQQRLRGKLAAGFTVSALPAGDKQSTLLSMFTFCMQHGMLWVGNPILPEQHQGVPYDEAANRLGSWSGLMAQADKASPGHAFAPGDIKTAHLFGQHFAHTLLRLHAGASLERAG